MTQLREEKGLKLLDLEDAITDKQNDMVKLEHEIKILHEEKEQLLTGTISSKFSEIMPDCCT